jgi:CHAT domain-containing protein
MYGRGLVIIGWMLRRRKLPGRGPLATARARRLAQALDHYVDKKDDLPRRLQSRLLELDAFFGGLCLADDGDAGNAGLSWVRAMITRMGREPRLFHLPLPKDRGIADLFELLARHYVRFGDWQYASECFAASAMYRPLRRSAAIRNAINRSIVCDLKSNADSAQEWIDLLPERISHRPSRCFRDIAQQVLSHDKELDANFADYLPSVRPLGTIVYTYLTSVVAGRLAAAGHNARALTVLDYVLAELHADHADDYLIGELEQMAASIHLAMGQHRTARSLALAAWAKLDAPRYLSCSHRLRHETWRNFSPARYAALRASVELGDARAITELIESARVQSLIATEIEIDHKEAEDKLEDSKDTVTAVTGQDTGTEQSDDVMVSSAVFTALNDGFGSTLLESQAPVTYKGLSVFPPGYLATAGGGQKTRALDDALPDGAFWSSHIENGVLFWSVVIDRDAVKCGMTDLRDHKNITPVLLGLAGHSESAEPDTWSLPPYQRQAGDYYEPYLHLATWKSPEEQIISHTVGALLPDELVNQLRQKAEPLEITIAAARELACVPWPIAIIPGTEERLIEHAILRMWTSAPTQLNRKSRTRPRPGTPMPFLLACDNPDGTLRKRAAFSPVSTAKTVLGGPDSATPATKDALLCAVHEIGSGTSGLFFYRGHALHDSDPAWSTLPLTEGEVHAGELFGVLDDGTPFLPMPARVIVSCCSSSGGSLLAGEGLGLAAGLIQAGAVQVISTAVDIMDASFTEAFEDLLIKGMLTPDADHAVVLRAAQLRMLREWKIYSLRGGVDHREDIKDPHPIIWSAYHAY